MFVTDLKRVRLLYLSELNCVKGLICFALHTQTNIMEEVSLEKPIVAQLVKKFPAFC
jgi:hypothetical protein